MGLHGNPLDLTPNLDRLAMRGTFVDKAFTCQPVCDLRDRLVRRMVAAGEAAPTIIPAPQLSAGRQRAPRSPDRT